MHRRVCTDKSLHRGVFAHKVFTHKNIYAQRSCHTQKLMHLKAFTQRSSYTQKLLHSDLFAQKSLYTETFTQKL